MRTQKVAFLNYRGSPRFGISQPEHGALPPEWRAETKRYTGVGGLRVCYKLQLDNRTSLGRYGVAPDRSWDRGSSYA